MKWTILTPWTEEADGESPLQGLYDTKEEAETVLAGFKLTKALRKEFRVVSVNL